MVENNEQIEQIARAILAADENDHDLLHLCGEPEKAATILARAAHSVMAGRIAALERVLREVGDACCGPGSVGRNLRLREMIDAALAPPRHD